eukprot:scaffold246902_cov43-Prasinocladus_malaysianus.AAC.5
MNDFARSSHFAPDQSPLISRCGDTLQEAGSKARDLYCSRARLCPQQELLPAPDVPGGVQQHADAVFGRFLQELLHGPVPRASVRPGAQRPG